MWKQNLSNLISMLTTLHDFNYLETDRSLQIAGKFWQKRTIATLLKFVFFEIKQSDFVPLLRKCVHVHKNNMHSKCPSCKLGEHTLVRTTQLDLFYINSRKLQLKISQNCSQNLFIKLVTHQEYYQSYKTSTVDWLERQSLVRVQENQLLVKIAMTLFHCYGNSNLDKMLCTWNFALSLANRCLVSSVGRAPVCCAGG